MGNTELGTDFVYALGDVTQATGYLTSALDVFAAVAKKMEQRYKELEDREAYLKEMEKDIAQRMEQLNEAEARWQEREARIRREHQEVEEKRVSMHEMEKRMSANITKLEAQVHLNVGGQRFTTTKETLLLHKNTYFEYMLSSTHPQKDKNGEYFIDHDPKYFGMLLNYLREGRLRNSELNAIDLEELQEEFRFYRIPTPPPLLEVRPPGPPESPSPSYSPTPSMMKEPPVHELHQAFEGGTLLSVEFKSEIAAWIPERHFVLQYKATRDGFSHSDFHERCDNKGPTLTVIQSNKGYLFGGYTSASWECLKTYKTDPATFVFTLSNPHNILPTPYVIKPEESHHAIYCHRSHGAVFGYGCDIYVSSESNENCNSFTRFPYSFEDTTGKGILTFTGARNFSTSEIEVYLVV